MVGVSGHFAEGPRNGRQVTPIYVVVDSRNRFLKDHSLLCKAGILTSNWLSVPLSDNFFKILYCLVRTRKSHGFSNVEA